MFGAGQERLGGLQRTLAQYSPLWEANEVSPEGKTNGGVYFSGTGEHRGRAESRQGHVLQLLIQGLEVIKEAGWSKDVRRAWAGGQGWGGRSPAWESVTPG